MELRNDISLQTRQVLSQTQVQSLNILSMSVTELQEFLQNEEIENPLFDYSGDKHENELPVVIREYDPFYSGTDHDECEHELYERETEQQKIEDLVFSQLAGTLKSGTPKKIVEFCINSLNQNGFLSMTVEEIARSLHEKNETVAAVLEELKALEPRGIFASGLKECLLLQIQGNDHEKLLTEMIQNHLQELADGKISNVSRTLKITSADVRKLFHFIKTLNPRPLNGYGSGSTQYIFPDVICTYQDEQWSISLNDKWMGSLEINSFYSDMMKKAHDPELKTYFAEKQNRAQFIIKAIKQRRRTILGVSEEILKCQSGYFLGCEALKPMTLEEIAEKREIHPSTVSRAIREKYILTPSGCMSMKSLFTTGISKIDANGAAVSRNEVKLRLKAVIDAESKANPYSDEQLTKLLVEEGIRISRRTVAKYRAELGIDGAFQRRIV